MIVNIDGKVEAIRARLGLTKTELAGKAGVSHTSIVRVEQGKSIKAWLANTAQSIGRGLGSAIKNGISALLGLDASGIAADAVGVGESFVSGFAEGIEGLDWKKVLKGVADALKWAVEAAFSNPVTGTLAAAWIGGKVLGGATGVYNAAKGAKSIWGTLFGTGAEIAGGAVTSGGGIFGGISQGLAIAKAAKTGGPAAESSLTFARAGQLGLGAKIGSAGVGGMAAGAAGIAGGVIGAATLISAASDYSKGAKSKNQQEAEAYKKSAAWKAGSTATGAGIGAGIHTTRM